MRKYKNVKGLQTGIQAALRRQGLEVSKWYEGRITSKRSRGVGTEIEYGINNDLVILGIYGGYNVSWDDLEEALEREGFYVETEVRSNSFQTIERSVISTEKYCEEVTTVC